MQPGWETVEQLAAGALVGMGYVVDRPIRQQLRFGGDRFNLFDILALRSDSLRLVQVKTGSGDRSPDFIWQLQVERMPQAPWITYSWWWMNSLGQFEVWEQTDGKRRQLAPGRLA